MIKMLNNSKCVDMSFKSMNESTKSLKTVVLPIQSTNLDFEENSEWTRVWVHHQANYGGYC